MGRSWQFFLTIAVISGVMGYLYYTSDFYAERSAGTVASPANEAALPSQAPQEREMSPPRNSTGRAG
jgi:hypothetical protein